MRRKYILALDSGTVKSRAAIFDEEANLVALVKKDLSIYRPQPGWVEQDADEIWGVQLFTAEQAIQEAGIKKSEIAAIGITNQRETTVIWNRRTGRPIHHAIGWQSMQTKEITERFRAQEGLLEEFRQNTAMVLSPYFSVSKICWLLENVPGARELAEAGELAFGTVDSWLLWKLTGGKVHATDASNASRTMLYHLTRCEWDETLLAHVGIPASLMPEVLPSSHPYGTTAAPVFGREIPISGIIGNQQADLFGQCCFTPGTAKNTYGGGSFFLLNTGSRCLPSRNGLNATIAWALDGKVTYALEGSIFVAGVALEWLRRGLKILDSLEDSEWIAKRVTDTAGVYFVPAFRGLSAPYWDSETRGMLIGLSEDTKRAHIVRAALAAMAYQVRDVYEAILSDAAMTIEELRVSGGASRNNLLMQLQAGILGIPVRRPIEGETTALGAAYMAGLAAGLWQDTEALSGLWREDACFMPHLSAAERDRLYDGWQNAVSHAIGWHG